MAKYIISLLLALVVGVASACSAVTKKGTICKRASVAGSQYCWQHGGRSSQSSASSSASAPSASSGATMPKSYQVYQQRKAQGARTFSKSMRVRKYNEQGGVCPHCGKKFSFGEMEGDHIVPYSKGGITEYSNLQMLCTPCNRSKSNRYSY